MNSVTLKKCSLVLLSLAIAFISTAQKKSSYFIELKGGLNAPVGDFANKTYSGNFPDQADGLAKVGFAGGLMAGYRFEKPFAVLISVGYSNNKQDGASFDAYLKKSLGSNTVTSVRTNAWSVFKIMEGGYFETPFSASSKLSFRGTIQAGVCKTNIPGFSYVYSTGASPGGQSGSVMYAKIKLPWTFCYTAAAGLKYKLNSTAYLLAEGSWFNSSPVYKYAYNPNFPTPGPMVAAKKQISLSSLQAMAGIGIEF